jgi:hypothetical protein
MGIFVFLFLLSLVCLVVGLIRPTVFSKLFGASVEKRRVGLIFGISTFALFVLVAITAPPVQEPSKPDASVQAGSQPASDQEARKNEAADSPATIVAKEEAQVTSMQTKVEQAIQGIGDFEVSVWDKNSEIATDGSQPPFEIIVNAKAGDGADCFGAKNRLFEIMKRLYSDQEIESDIARVIFTQPGQIRASLGRDDAKTLSWNDLGPSNFWKVFLQFKDYEDENGELASRTWGKSINPECK